MPVSVILSWARVYSLVALLLTFGACGDRPVLGDELLPEMGRRDSGREAGRRDSGREAGMCFVDFPCGPEEKIHCSGPDTYVEVTTDWDCHNYCPPGPCSGAVCVPSSGDVKKCPAGQICVSTGGPFDRCAIPDAGPPPTVDSGTCPKGQDLCY